MNCSEPGALTLDGDIAGTGVRVSFYVQNFILVLLMKKSHYDTENALWTFVATSFGLIVAAIVQLTAGSFTFIDGIVVSQLVWFSNLGTFLALASYSRTKGKDAVIKIAATLQGYLSMLLTIAMWSLSDRLPYGSCESIKFVFMFAVELPAPTSGRVFALVSASLALVTFTVLTCIEVWVWVKRRGSYGLVMAGVPDIERRLRHEHRRSKSAHHNHHLHESAKQHVHHHTGKHDRFHERWAGSLYKLGSFFFGILLSQIVIFVYFISTTELIIRRSHANLNPSTWTFGQVLALTVVLPSLVALLRAFWHGVKDKWAGDGDAVNNQNYHRSMANPESGPEPLPLVPHTRSPTLPDSVRADLELARS